MHPTRSSFLSVRSLLYTPHGKVDTVPSKGPKSTNEPGRFPPLHSRSPPHQALHRHAWRSPHPSDSPASFPQWLLESLLSSNLLPSQSLIPSSFLPPGRTQKPSPKGALCFLPASSLTPPHPPQQGRWLSSVWASPWTPAYCSLCNFPCQLAPCDKFSHA